MNSLFFQQFPCWACLAAIFWPWMRFARALFWVKFLSVKQICPTTVRQLSATAFRTAKIFLSLCPLSKILIRQFWFVFCYLRSWKSFLRLFCKLLFWSWWLCIWHIKCFNLKNLRILLVEVERKIFYENSSAVYK